MSNCHGEFPINKIQFPKFIYGTAWKEEQTQHFVNLALREGFRGIDTANQRRHYDEAAVGQAIALAIQSGFVARDDLFVQTKFTFLRGQDARLPYDPQAPVPLQVEQSFDSSLDHLRTNVIDCYILHGPTHSRGLTSADWQAWQALENIYQSGRVRFLGISNVSLEQLERLCQQALIPPRVVQNRCYAKHGWDKHVRRFCSANKIIYQGFSLLTANREVATCPEMVRICARYGLTTNQIVFRFAIEVGMVPLTGTSNVAHMREDLAIFDFNLEPDVIACIEKIVEL